MRVHCEDRHLGGILFDTIIDIPHDDSRYYVENYKLLNTAGNVLLIGGLVATVVGGNYPLFATDVESLPYSGISAMHTSLIISGSGFIALMAGSFMLPASYSNLIQSVNLFNRAKMAEF